MRIVFLTWRDRSHPDGGGSEVYVESVAAELARRGHDVRIRCAAHPGALPDELRDGVRIQRRGGRLTVYPRALLWLATRGRNTDVAVDVVNGIPFGVPLVRRHGVVSLFHHVHREQWHIIYPDWRGRFGWWVESTLVPHLYRRVPVLTVSESSRHDLVALGTPASAVSIARNGLAHRPVAGPLSTPPRACVLARLVPHKQIEIALRVVAAARSHGLHLPLDVIGEGWWHDQLVAETAKLGVTDLVTFHGHVDDDVRDRLLAGASLMLMPSVKEGWCLAIVEAAAQGTPTIAFRHAGGTTESVVHGRTGLLVDSEDQMVTQTLALLADPSRRCALADAARERAATFSWTATTDVVERVLVRAIRSRR